MIHSSEWIHSVQHEYQMKLIQILFSQKLQWSWQAVLDMCLYIIYDMPSVAHHCPQTKHLRLSCETEFTNLDGLKFSVAWYANLVWLCPDWLSSEMFSCRDTEHYDCIVWYCVMFPNHAAWLFGGLISVIIGINCHGFNLLKHSVSALFGKHAICSEMHILPHLKFQLRRSFIQF